jgi:WxL domain surface cell wall-binding
MAGRLPCLRSIPLLWVCLSVGLAHASLTASPALAAIEFVQKAPMASAGGSTVTATLANPTSAGTLLVAVVKDINSGCASDSYSGPAGWARAARVCRGSNGPLELWYRANTPSGVASVTFGTGSSGANSVMQVSEWSGVATSSPLDQTGSQYTSSTSTTLGVTTSGALASSGELAITGFDTSSGLSSFTPGSGWTGLRSDPGAGFDTDYRIGPSSGATLTESPSSSPQTAWSAVIATFLPACTGGSRTLKANNTLTFPGVTLNGYDRSTSTAVAITADDETGSGAGWSLNATSTRFSDGSGHTLPATATTFTAGSASAATGSCALPANSIMYPVTLPAGASPPTAVRLFNAAGGTGSGPTDLALTANVAVPANAWAASYSSTWTFTLSSGP